LDRHVRRNGGSTSSVIERLLDEALRVAEDPLVFFQDGPAGRRPKLQSGPDVWEVISALWDVRAEHTPALTDSEAVVRELIEVCGISKGLVRAAISYYAQFTGEIDAWIQEHRDLSEELEAAWLREQAILAGPAA